MSKTQAIRIAFGVTMGLGLIMILAMWLHWGWGISIMVIFCLLATMLFTAIAAGLGVLLVMINDACPSAEGIFVNAADYDAKALVRLVK